LAQELTTDGTTPYEFANAGDTVTVSVYAESRSEATDFDIELWSGGSPATGAEIGNSGPIAMAALGQSGPYSLESYTYTATAADVGEVLWFAFRDMTTLSDDLANLTLDLVSASYTPTSTAFHPGDANLDGKVDINDLTIVLSNFGSTGCAWSQGCMDGDPTGTVDVNDLTIVLANFGTTYGASSNIKAVPEPSTITLLLASAACLLAFAWRRPTA
jgi:hypothetical protein